MFHELFDIAKEEREAHRQMVYWTRRRRQLRLKWLAAARRIAGRQFVPLPWGVQGIPNNVIKLGEPMKQHERARGETGKVGGAGGAA